MPVVAEAERSVDLGRDEAFDLFIDFPRWSQWMPKVFEPLSGPDRPLRDGDVFRVRLPPMPANVRVFRIRRPHEVCWGGGIPGLHAEHSFFFEEEGPSRTRIRSVEPWTGFLTSIGPIARKVQRDATMIGGAQLDGFLGFVRSLREQGR